MRFFLIYGSAEEFEITTKCQIGRREGDLKFSDEHLSGVHAKFYIENNVLYVTDLGSSNGTSLNGKKLTKHAPYELRNEDKVELGSQVLEIKITDVVSSIKVELPPQKDKATVIKHTPAESSWPSVSNFESISYNKEATRVESLDETQEEYVPPAIHEATHIEALPPQSFLNSEAVPTETPSHRLLQVEPDRVAPRAAPLPIAEATPVPENLSLKERIIHSIQSLNATFGKQQVVLAGILIVGVFTLLLLSLLSSPKQEAPSQTQKKTATAPVRKKKTSPPQAIDIPSSIETPYASRDNDTSSAESTYTIQAASTDYPAENHSPSLEENAQTKDLEEVQKAIPKVKKKTTNPQRKVVAKSSPQITTPDPYQELKLLHSLQKIKTEAKRTRSSRVKAALEIDANEAVSKHYKKIKAQITGRWKNSRNLASTEREQLKKTLQQEMKILLIREKEVKSRIHLYVHGKLNTPL